MLADPLALSELDTITRDEAFEKYIGSGGSCFVPKFRLSLEDTAKLLKFSGAAAVIAHPVKYQMTDDEYFTLFSYARSLGIMGIEAIHPDNSFDDELFFQDIASYLNMFVTGGSDYRGARRPDIDMGTGKGNLMIPASMLQQIVKPRR